MKGRLPDFMIIGAMKSGTTSLHDYLGKHPQIFTSKVKEIHYFANDKYQKYDLEWYKNHFISEKKIVGTSPQNYTKCHNKYYQDIPERIKKHIPDIKLIYILRDPIERYKSHILENYYGEPKKDMVYNIQTNQYEKTGLYHYQLQEYLKYFDLSQIHILTLEDLRDNRLVTLNKVFTFLGVQNIEDERLFDFVSNDHRAKALPYNVISTIPYRALHKFSPNFAKKIVSSELLRKIIFKKGKKRHLKPQEIERLKVVYSEDKKALEQLTGLSFDKWNL
ncbi:sulfotransferase domain-containing protein [Winogradskyella flava]|uniref:Sulfotransferase domain-containing protein n=1 Tax=Winogradskyella flava TaxID=1884876 RepID=A0A842IML0_9FLAO|nr:sulfotransferase domain-containing protein [Winogradskyella flava]MBC2844482.1 sulfotransferase domain-containing protein [Winogradskyella flava]